jgi:hypothetical protein
MSRSIEFRIEKRERRDTAPPRPAGPAEATIRDGEVVFAACRHF